MMVRIKEIEYLQVKVSVERAIAEVALEALPASMDFFMLA
jgi:hypothetical protein